LLKVPSSYFKIFFTGYFVKRLLLEEFSSEFKSANLSFRKRVPSEEKKGRGKWEPPS
jgi:hypothetical protein